MTSVTNKCDAYHFCIRECVRDLRSSPDGPGTAEELIGSNRIVSRVERDRIRGGGAFMRAPYGLEIIENCVTCPHREDRLFCNLPPAALQRLSEITSASSYPKGATLFVEGQAPRGVFILCGGRVKLSTSSTDGKTLIVRISEPGEVLGLPATVTGKPYELTADVLEPTQANFISRKNFLDFLREYGEVALRVAQQLGETYHAAVAEMRSIGLSHSAGEKLARSSRKTRISSSQSSSSGANVAVSFPVKSERLRVMTARPDSSSAYRSRRRWGTPSAGGPRSSPWPR